MTWEAGRAGLASCGENKAKGDLMEVLRNLKWRRWRQIRLRDAQQKVGRKRARVKTRKIPNEYVEKNLPSVAG